jgi:hypothetical protein
VGELLEAHGNDDLAQLCYISRATRLMTTDDLSEILASARRNNAAKEISGMLLYKDLSFLQVLEGRRESLAKLYATIRGDERHTKVRILYEQPIQTREFAEWHMAFQNLDGLDLSDMAGYSDLMQANGSARDLFDDPTRAKRLLLLFRARS